MGLLTPKAVITRIDSLSGDRGTLDNHWQEIADFMLPRKDTFVRTQVTEGEKRNVTLLNNTAMQSGLSLAAVMHSLLTNPSRQFFSLTSGDVELDDNDKVRKWFQKTVRQIHLTLNNSNFQTEIHEVYIDLVFFGISSMGIEPDDDTVIRFITQHMSNAYIQENNKGIIDQIFIKQNWTPENLIREFGRENVSKDVIKALEDSSNKKFEVIQAIYPRDIENIQVQSRFGFISQWVLRNDAMNLRVKGFNEFPYVTPRWSKASGETYGRGPGAVALPDSKTINEMDRTILIGAQKTVDPPLQLPDDGFLMPIFTLPGGMNFYRAGTVDRITPILNDARIDFGNAVLQERMQRIRKSFHVDELKLGEGPQMTATEVFQRTEDSMRVLGPVLARLQGELLRPLVDRVFSVMDRRNMFDDLPRELLEFSERTGRKIDVQFSGLIAKAQRVTEGQSIERTLAQAAPFIQLDPNSADLFDSDAAIRAIARVNEPPAELIRDSDKIDKIREDRSEAAKKQQAEAETAQTADNVAKVAPAIAMTRPQQ